MAIARMTSLTASRYGPCSVVNEASPSNVMAFPCSIEDYSGPGGEKYITVEIQDSPRVYVSYASDVASAAWTKNAFDMETPSFAIQIGV